MFLNYQMKNLNSSVEGIEIDFKVLFFMKEFTTIRQREKCPHSELLWFAFSRIRNEYGEIRSILLYSVSMPGNADQSNSK